MAISLERKADFYILSFGPELNIFTVGEDFASVQALQHESISQLMFDVSQVSDFDSAGLQLLLWLRQYLRSDEPIRWIGLDNPVIAKVADLFQVSLAQSPAATADIAE